MKSFLTKKAGLNIYTVFCYRILLIMFLLTLSRIGFYLFNLKMFSGMSFSSFLQVMRGGLVFDLSAVTYFNLLIILLHIFPFDLRYNVVYEKVTKYLFFVFNGIMLSINGADYVYCRFLAKRATADIFGTFRNEVGLEKMFFRLLYDYWPVTLFTLFLLGLMVFLYTRVKPEKPVVRNRVLYFSLNLAIVPLVLTLSVGAARGGFKHSTRPITISNAARYVDNPKYIPIVLNTPFSIIRTSGIKELQRYNFYSKPKLDSIFNPVYNLQHTDEFDSLNVIIIILESFSREYTGFFNRDLENGTYKGYTPFLDSLLSVSLSFDESFANGSKSIDAMPSILASMPSLETPYIISHYANNEIKGLPALLKTRGYYSAFFHGAANGSMGFDSFAKMAGFDSYFGMNEYTGEEAYDGMWGIYDEPFLKFFLEKTNEFPQPFLSTVFTLSSHHPFEVPPGYDGRFRKGPIPVCETVGYTDFVLSRFFNEVSKKSWYRNTVFVITSDHTNEKMFREYENSYGQFSIPILFFHPGGELKGTRKKIAQQIDIMPTLLSYLNYNGQFVAFGNNLLDNSKETFAFNTFGNNYFLFMRDHVLEMIDNTTAALYNYKTDRFYEKNLAGYVPELQPLMEEKLKSIIQSYNQRMLDNELVVR